MARLLTKLGAIIIDAPGATTVTIVLIVANNVPGVQTAAPLLSETVVLSNSPVSVSVDSTTALFSATSVAATVVCSNGGCNVSRLTMLVVTVANVAIDTGVVSMVAPMFNDTV